MSKGGVGDRSAPYVATTNHDDVLRDGEELVDSRADRVISQQGRREEVVEDWIRADIAAAGGKALRDDALDLRVD